MSLQKNLINLNIDSTKGEDDNITLNLIQDNIIIYYNKKKFKYNIENFLNDSNNFIFNNPLSNEKKLIKFIKNKKINHHNVKDNILYLIWEIDIIDDNIIIKIPLNLFILNLNKCNDDEKINYYEEKTFNLKKKINNNNKQIAVLKHKINQLENKVELILQSNNNINMIYLSHIPIDSLMRNIINYDECNYHLYLSIKVKYGTYFRKFFEFSDTIFNIYRYHNVYKIKNLNDINKQKKYYFINKLNNNIITVNFLHSSEFKKIKKKIIIKPNVSPILYYVYDEKNNIKNLNFNKSYCILDVISFNDFYQTHKLIIKKFNENY